MLTHSRVAFILCCTLGLSAATAAPPPVSADYKIAEAAYERGDYGTASRAFAELEQAGDTNARGALSLMYLQGRGVPKDVDAAERLSQSAAIEGVALAQYVQGLLRGGEEGRTPNYAESAKWFMLAAQQGYAPAQSNLGALYFMGRGVPQDAALGLSWTQKAAEQGALMAQENMGKACFEGAGTPVDYKKSAYWYTKAARQGSAKALGWLGVMYIRGAGFAESKVNAYAYLDIAGKRGDVTARMNQAKLHPQLTDDELARARKLFADWKPGNPLPRE